MAKSPPGGAAHDLRGAFQPSGAAASVTQADTSHSLRPELPRQQHVLDRLSRSLQGRGRYRAGHW